MNTKKLKQLVLDLAIHGKLVPQDPNDEPASELLKRIKAASVETHGRASKNTKGKKSSISSEEIDEVPFEVPEGWCWCRLSDIAKIGTGSTPATTNKSYYDGSIAWISSGSTKEDYIEHATAYITDLAIKETNCQVYPVGTLIMAMYGEGKTRGQISELKIEAATNQACAAIQLEEETLKDYIKVYLMGNYWSLREMAEGGLQPNLNLKKISSYNIPLPPLAEQHRIVAAIEKWFAVIDQLEKNEADLKKSIEQTKKKVLDLAIRGKLVAQNPEDESAGELLARIRADVETHGRASNKAKGKKSAIPSVDLDEVPFEVPEGWEWCRLGEVIDLLSGRDLEPSQYDSTQSGLPYITGASNFDNGSLIVNRWTDSPVCISKFGDLLITCKGTVGELAYNTIGDIHIARQIMAISSQFVNVDYIRVLIMALIDELQYQANSLIPGISRDVLLKLVIPLPPLAEQKRIVEKIEEVMGVLERIEGMM